MSNIAQDLVRKKCAPCEGGVDPMTEVEIGRMLKGLQGWSYTDGTIRKSF
jgi:4a-hydroxytetrahydrobiopterin dehydratase